MSRPLEDALEAFRQDVSAFLSTGIVHRSEGTAIASVITDDLGGADPQLGEAYLAELFKLHQRAQTLLKREGETEDLVISTSGGLLLARSLPESEYLWAVVVGSGANIALTRALMRRHHDKITAALP